MKKKLTGVLFLFLAVVFVVSGFSSSAEHSTLGGLIVGAVFASFSIRKLGIPGKKAPKAEAPAAVAAPIQPVTSVPDAAKVPDTAPQKKTVYAPNVIDGCQYVYDYKNVEVIPCAGVDTDSLEQGSKVSFEKGTDVPCVYVDGQKIATMRKNRLADMVSDWLRRGDPIFSVIESSGENKIHLFMVFYRDQIAEARRRGLKPIKLVGNSNQEMQDSISFKSVGDLCGVVWDDEKQKWDVFSDCSTIGYLPGKYDMDSISEDTHPVISDIEENMETGKYSVWVYII